jgi:hypothetical protein
MINDGGTETTPIKSGDTFVFKTANPDMHPLPRFSLLEMQWHLNRIVAMCGAAEIYDSDNDDDDDHCDAGAVYKSPAVASWVSSLSSLNTFDEEDRLDYSVTAASSGPSPQKVREQATMLEIEEDEEHFEEPISSKIQSVDARMRNFSHIDTRWHMLYFIKC